MTDTLQSLKDNNEKLYLSLPNELKSPIENHLQTIVNEHERIISIRNSEMMELLMDNEAEKRISIDKMKEIYSGLMNGGIMYGYGIKKCDEKKKDFRGTVIGRNHIYSKHPSYTTIPPTDEQWKSSHSEEMIVVNIILTKLISEGRTPEIKIYWDRHADGYCPVYYTGILSLTCKFAPLNPDQIP